MNNRKLAAFSAVALTLFAAVIQIGLASQYSIWGDEWDTIKPVFLPFTGEKNFLWQIHQYPGCPPGDYLVLRWFYQSGILEWLHKANEQIFWRIPYVLLYAITGLATFFLARRWSSSSVLALLALALYLASPSTFAFATETRFYAWALFFTTIAIWQSMTLIDREFDIRDLVLMSMTCAIGVCFHVALALFCYLLFWLVIFICANDLRKKKKVVKPALGMRILLGLTPFLLFKYEKHHWMSLPQGDGLLSALGSLGGFIPETNSAISEQLFFSSVNLYWPLVAVIVLILLFDVCKKGQKNIFYDLLLLSILAGGTSVLYLSTKATHYPLYARNYIFVVPVAIAGFVFVVKRASERVHLKLPAQITGLILILISIFGASRFLQLANIHSTASSSKLSSDLHRFREFYSHLPDRHQLIVVGAGDGDLWANSDLGGYLGGVHIIYTEGFKPLFLTTRQRPRWIFPKAFDILTIGPADKLKPLFPQVPWQKLACSSWSVGDIAFCRAEISVLTRPYKQHK